MAYFLVIAQDKPAHHDLRLNTRAAHLEHLNQLPDQVRLDYGGPLLDPAGTVMIGSMLVFEAPTHDHVAAIMERDPYCQAGLFDKIEIQRFKRLKPE